MPPLRRLPGQRQRLPPRRTRLLHLPQLIMQLGPRRMRQVIVQQFTPRQNPFDLPQANFRPVPLRQRHRPVQLHHR
ncbi:hypothetical protein D3C80_1921130 [compost metagenome]